MTSSQRSRAALRGRLFFFLAVVGAVAIWWGLRDRPAPLDVLVISIDTLRADAVETADAPALVELAARGRLFRRARTPVPLTLPAHVTLLSGLDPPAHGIRDNTAPPLPARAERSFTLLAEEFRDRGYATAAFVASAVLDPRYRLDAGFDEYRHPPAQEAGVPLLAALTAEEQVARVKAWLGARPRERPFFVWVHLWEPHAPYEVYDGDERRAGTAAADPAPERYRGEVRRSDAAVEALLQLIDPARTVVVATSDHGESLGEHGEPTHGFLCYATTMDVPLILAGPGVPTGTEERLCALADVAPTLRRLCGLRVRAGDGRDLLALPGERVVVGESLHAYRRYRWAQQSVAFDGRFSLVDGGPRLELFDRAADPPERHPLPDPQAQARFPALDRALLAYRRRRGPAGEAEAIPAPLYYGTPSLAQSEFRPVRENRRLPDVVAMLPHDLLVGRAQAAIAARDAPLLRQLMPRLGELEAADPANPALALVRGRALLLVLQEPARAAEALKEAIRRGYDATDLYRLLARAYREAGDTDGLARIRARLEGGKKRPK
ncbi:MAG: sulfatase-like hydrolase/transferase [Planctomycetota bacterium]